jgi:hypothetical protein
MIAGMLDIDPASAFGKVHQFFPRVSMAKFGDSPLCKSIVVANTSPNMINPLSTTFVDVGWGYRPRPSQCFGSRTNVSFSKELGFIDRERVFQLVIMTPLNVDERVNIFRPHLASIVERNVTHNEIARTVWIDPQWLDIDISP